MKAHPEVISSNELRAIVGGTYGGWSDSDPFLNSVNQLTAGALFNFNGTQDFQCEYDMSSSDNSSYFSGSSPFANYFFSGSNSTFSFGSGHFNGSGVYQPGSLFGNFGSLATSFTIPNLTPHLNITSPNGTQLDIRLDLTTGKMSVGIKIPF